MVLAGRYGSGSIRNRASSLHPTDPHGGTQHYDDDDNTSLVSIWCPRGRSRRHVFMCLFLMTLILIGVSILTGRTYHQVVLIHQTQDVPGAFRIRHDHDWTPTPYSSNKWCTAFSTCAHWSHVPEENIQEFIHNTNCTINPPIASTFYTTHSPDTSAVTGSTYQHRWRAGQREKHRSKAAIIVESRAVDRLIRVILQFMSVLDDDWEFQVYHGNRNERMLRDSVALQKQMALGRLKLYPMGRDIFDVQWYNTLFTANDTFWWHVAADHILVFQVDAVLCSASPVSIDSFLSYDYIGAPWPSNYSVGGNGGLSLRSRDLMILCQMPSKGGTVNEDLHHSLCGTAYTRKVAPRHVAQTFSVETQFYATPFGIHNAWMYLPKSQVRQLLEYCPEIEDAIRFKFNEKFDF